MWNPDAQRVAMVLANNLKDFLDMEKVARQAGHALPVVLDLIRSFPDGAADTVRHLWFLKRLWVEARLPLYDGLVIKTIDEAMAVAQRDLINAIGETAAPRNH